MRAPRANADASRDRRRLSRAARAHSEKADSRTELAPGTPGPQPQLQAEAPAMGTEWTARDSPAQANSGSICPCRWRLRASRGTAEIHGGGWCPIGSMPLITAHWAHATRALSTSGAPPMVRVRPTLPVPSSSLRIRRCGSALQALCRCELRAARSQIRSGRVCYSAEV